MNKAKWNKIEGLLDKYDIKPIVGVIPNNEDAELLKYEQNHEFWNTVRAWRDKGWTIGMHGYNHVYSTTSGGINPVNKRSEFAGLSLEKQKGKIQKGIQILNSQGINPEVFIAPSHTFDENTLNALEEISLIRIISDTVANDVYFKSNFFFLPQQSGKVRRLPFKVITFCYHPNQMIDEDFIILEEFIKSNKNKFECMHTVKLKKRKKSLLDSILSFLYFSFHSYFKG
jgi:Predicted deacetylase